MIGLLQPAEYYTRMQRGPILNQLYQIGQFFSAPSLYLFDERQSFLLKSRYNQALNTTSIRQILFAAASLITPANRISRCGLTPMNGQ